jgi:hypothetical protein
MMRTKDRFYWSDRLYMARVKDGLIPVEHRPGETIFQCRNCAAMVKFKVSDAGRKTGQWFRLKPYEHYQLMKSLDRSGNEEKVMEIIEAYKNPARKLFQCKYCASYWWKENEGWERADDEVIESA